jgi:DNA-binding response OmpR family regulator
VLFFDDEPAVTRIMALALRPYFELDASSTLGEFVTEARRREHVALVIDWNLRFAEGTAVCADLRADGEDRPIAIMSGKLEPHHGRQLAIGCGANEYIEKPIQLDDLVCTMRRLVAAASIPKKVFRCSFATFELGDDHVIVSNLMLRLRAKEIAVLADLLLRAGTVVSRDDLARRVWGVHTIPTTKIVETTIGRLREGLGSAAPAIETVSGGYIIRVRDV